MNAEQRRVSPAESAADEALRDRWREPVAAWVAGQDVEAQHLDVELLTAYQLAELSEERQEEVRNHLERCPACVDRLLDLDAFLRPPDPTAGGSLPTDLETAAAWRSLRASLAGERSGRSGGSGWSSWRPAAAVLALAVVGAGMWVLGERHGAATGDQALEADRQPATAVEIVDLYPDSAVRGEGEGALVAEVSEVASFSILVAHLAGDARQYALYEAELRTPDHHLVWSGELGAASDLGTLRIGLPAGYLPAGPHSLLLFGRDGEERHWVETYPLEVVAR